MHRPRGKRFKKIRDRKKRVNKPKDQTQQYSMGGKAKQKW